MFDYDRSNFIKFLKEFPKQPRIVSEIMNEQPIELDTSNIQNIVFTGMGGSAIAGDLFLGYVQDELKLPALVNRDYNIPNFVNQNTLFIATSYSGNTEEALSTLNKAHERKATIVGISSDGELEEFCRKNDYTFIKVPSGLPPRQALGFLFFPLVFLFERLGFISSKKAEVSETEKLLQELLGRYNMAIHSTNNVANQIAQSVYNSIPLIYTGAPFLHVLPVRWRNQFNENSKILAFSNVFPELNHNEIMGWEGIKKLRDYVRVLLLRDTEESRRMQQRISITKKIIQDQGVQLGEVFSEGQSRLARLFSLIYVGDWASYYLAMLNEKDPIKIDSIDLLKQKLSESNN